jgi:vitamin K-dependent gamma-carboxylase-like protein
MILEDSGWLRRLILVAKNFLIAPAPARGLAYLRIGLGIFLIAKSIAVSGHLLQSYGMRGATQWGINEAIIDPSELRLSWIANALQGVGIDDRQTVLLVFAVQVIAAIGLILGWQTRFAALLAWLAHSALENSGAASTYGADQFAHIFLFYCLVMPVGHSLSLDAALRKSPYPATSSARIFQRLLQFHLCITYFSSGLAKARGPQWWNGEAIWRSLMQEQFHLNSVNVSWLASYPWMAIGLGWMVLVLEMAYPILIWPRWTRNWWLLAIVLMHIGIGIFMGLWLFALVMIAANLAAFGSPLLDRFLASAVGLFRPAIRARITSPNGPSLDRQYSDSVSN